EKIRLTNPDAVLVLLPPAAQEFFLSQFFVADIGLPITGYPHVITQTRDYTAHLLQAAPSESERVSLWDATLVSHGAQELNDQFLSQFGRPMDPSGWAAYAAIKILADAAAQVASTDTNLVVEFLEHPDSIFDVGKGSNTMFQADTHQLL